MQTQTKPLLVGSLHSDGSDLGLTLEIGRWSQKIFSVRNYEVDRVGNSFILCWFHLAMSVYKYLDQLRAPIFHKGFLSS